MSFIPSSFANVWLTSSDESPFRRERLICVLSYAQGYADAKFGSTEMLKNLVELNDHKGDLTVSWKSIHAARTMANCLEAAWMEVGREPKENVTHVIAGGG